MMIDVDGVIVAHPDPRGWSVNLERDLGLKVEVLQEKFFAPNFEDIVHGRAALRERLAPVLAEIAPHLTCDQLCDYWFRADSHLDHELLAELAEVRARGVELHLATVQEHERAAYLWETMGLKDRFDAMHYAAALGHAKPAPGFYAEIEARTGFAPQDLFFIDDKAANVEAARARGWKAAVWTTGRQRLADLLAEAGL
ncbi:MULTISPECIES: HAD-IA family hydrolase [Phenylobacterium]